MVETDIKIWGDYRLTKNDNFAIKPVPPDENSEAEFQTTSDYLFVKDNFDMDSAPVLAQMIKSGFIVIAGTQKINKKTYTKLSYRRLLRDEREYKDENGLITIGNEGINENDCLKFGESMILSHHGWTTEKVDDVLKMEDFNPVMESINGTIFGKSTAQNRRILKAINETDKNDNASPQPGQCYAIVRKNGIIGRADYHIAFVLFIHEGIAATIEAEADNGPTYNPQFCFYDTDPAKHTFHKRWTGQIYTDNGDPRRTALYKNGETIVLQGRECVVNGTWEPNPPKKIKVSAVVPETPSVVPATLSSRKTRKKFN
jgi:hypothetical protein